jgi:glycine/D-amino acid oxidase-like deaminating enzyme
MSGGRRRFLKSLAIAGGSAGAAGLVNALSPRWLPEERVFEPNASYWSKSLPPPLPALAEDADFDAVVVGGGFTGLSCAYYLRKRFPERRIAVLEASICGNGASGRNGAMVLTMTENTYMRLGSDPKMDRALYDLTADNVRRLEALAREQGVDCELERGGALQTLLSPEESQAAMDYCREARARGLPIDYWNAQKTADAIGTRVYSGALFDPGGGQVHPGKLVALWKKAAAQAGVEIHEYTPVTGIQEGAVHELQTAAGRRIRTPMLVLATNAFTSRLGYLRRAVVPIFDYVGMTPPLSDAQWAASGWTSRIPFNDTRTETYYAGMTRDRRIHFGGGPVDYTFNDGLRTPAVAARRHRALHAEFARLFPSLADLPFEVAWAGAVDMSLDGSPAVGTLGRRGNVFYAIGYSGHGVNLTSVFGRVLADLVAGDREPWRWLPFLDRLPPYIPNEPFRWLGVRADIEWQRLTDA